MKNKNYKGTVSVEWHNTFLQETIIYVSSPSSVKGDNCLESLRRLVPRTFLELWLHFQNSLLLISFKIKFRVTAVNNII